MFVVDPLFVVALLYVKFLCCDLVLLCGSSCFTSFAIILLRKRELVALF